MNKPLVTVFVPVYNVEKYLNDCIQSIVNQSYKNLDILLIDDGSTDNSPEICDEWVKRDSRIRVIHKSNSGIADVRNIGVSDSKGEFISQIDSDDLIHEKFIEKMMNAMLETNADLVVCNFQYFTNNEEISLNKQLKKNKYKLFSNEEYLKKIFCDEYVKYVVAWNKIYKKDLFDEIQYPTNLIHEDTYTTYKLIYKAKKIVELKDELNFYRRNVNKSIMDSVRNDVEKTLQSINIYNLIFEDRLEFIRNNNLGKTSYINTLYFLYNVYIMKYKNNISFVLDEFNKLYVELNANKRYLKLKRILKMKYFYYKIRKSNARK